MNPNLQAEFWHLIEAAKRAGQTVDEFDLRSEDPRSASDFQRLLDQSRAAATNLVNFVALNAVQLRHDLAE